MANDSISKIKEALHIPVGNFTYMEAKALMSIGFTEMDKPEQPLTTFYNPEHNLKLSLFIYPSQPARFDFAIFKLNNIQFRITDSDCPDRAVAFGFLVSFYEEYIKLAHFDKDSN